jgi:hypothetical protein
MTQHHAGNGDGVILKYSRSKASGATKFLFEFPQT